MGRKLYIRFTVFAAVLLLASSFYYLPYYVSKPGMAQELEPIIEVENGFDEEGSFMLTTVRMGRANIYSYIIAQFSKYQEIYTLEEIRGEGETDEQYTARQMHLMAGSKTSAIEVAYKKAGIPVNYEYNGVYVFSVLPDMPAEEKLKPGDLIVEVDGQELTTSEEFIEYVGGKQAGTEIELSFKRNGKSKSAELILKPLPGEPERAGVGIFPVDDKEIIVKPPVNLKTDEIGGPSAGFMFSLEIYNQLIEEDLTKGYEIAGTGTISSDGTIGRIGGIEQKIVAADKAGADIFFAPNEDGAEGSNYEAAVRTAEDIETNMKVVPVNNFNDAVSYLESLKEEAS
ncbi:SepM family pheromone-processing serine protease [Mesobacillus harenae]|uniref:SepM family pheromone-processing serine protease n=1 Tax=Mesobacillus harenae TaxID=2213203 RepID=UPI001580346F|nr:SepM family pheromone-processing serine protease [Mesobacillus harenae]